MRYSLWGIFTDEFGTVVNSASIAVYNIRTPTLATIYASWSGGSAVTSSTVFTNSFGLWRCYVDDNDFPMPGSEWDLVAKKPGYNTQSYTAVR